MADRYARRTFLGQLAVPPLAAFAPAPNDSDEAVFAAARRQFLFPEDVTYCNTGTLGASPREVMDALTGGLERLERELPDWSYYQSDGEPLTGYQSLTEFRAEAGAFINATADETAITQNATMGMSFLAGGLDLNAGDEVLTTDQEHSGGIGGWRVRAKRHGIVVKELPLAPVLHRGPEGIVDLFASAVTPKTRVVMFSHITSQLGILLPARELCRMARDHGALSVVDGAQAVGQIRVDVKQIGCDAYVTSPHKWLLAPKGTGILYIKRDVQPRIWNTLASGNPDPNDDIARFIRYGTGSLPVVHGLRAALRFMNKIGMERIERWDRMLATRLRDGLARIPAARLDSPADPRLHAAITTFGVKGKTGSELQDALWTRKIRVRAQRAHQRVRLAAHLYVSPADIDRTLDVVASLGAQ
ncbi:MAG: aminotransferase class V-fold PLP-dependent enzyme [bacterium]|nr:aminotransferase class V-fold PLP-dependent enzyme [bacterium]